MTQQNEWERKHYLRQYFRSPYVQILSWLCLGLILGSFFVSAYRVWFLFAAAAVSFMAMVPVLRTIPSRNIDIENKNERRTLLILSIYIAALIIGALIYGLYRTSH